MLHVSKLSAMHGVLAGILGYRHSRVVTDRSQATFVLEPFLVSEKCIENRFNH